MPSAELFFIQMEINEVQKYSGIGGQAIIEGIMMRAGKNYSIAVRKPDGEIAVEIKEFKSICPWKKAHQIPLLRGAIAFVDSLVTGVTSLTRSADLAVEDEEEEGGKEKNEKDEKKEELLWKIMLGATVAFAIAFSVVLLMLLPYFLSGFLRKFGLSEVLVHLCEAVLRLLIFLIYMLLISRMKDIQRVFGYHGAEHKCINCIEHNLELNVENVMKSSRQHKRCGTSFLLIVVVISIIAFLILGLFGIQSRLWRLLWRLILIPVIAGISFELLRYAGCHEGPVINVLVKPGLALQKLVTREPDEKMCEVAIAAVNAVFDWKEWQEQNR